MEDSFQFSQMKDFDIIRKIGQGSYGIVYKTRRKTDQKLYAIKVLHIQQLNEYQIENQLREITILSQIHNKFLVDYKEAFLQQDKMQMCVVMQYEGGGDLRQKIKKMRKDLLGLKSLHDQKIIHRDIKSANLFLSQDEKIIKLGDLNVAKQINEDCASTRIGTPYYIAPEIWHNKQYDFKCDIYSLGCVVYEMAALKVPFRGKNLQQLFHNIINGEYNRIPSEYSDQLFSVIKMMLQKDPQKRPSIKQLLELKIIQEKLVKFKLDFFLDDFQSLQVLNCNFNKFKNLEELKNQLPKKKRYKMRRSTKLKKETRNKVKRFTVFLNKDSLKSNSVKKNQVQKRLIENNLKKLQKKNKDTLPLIPSIKLLPQIKSSRTPKNSIGRNSSRFLNVGNTEHIKRNSIITKSFQNFLKKFKQRSSKENRNLLIQLENKVQINQIQQINNVKTNQQIILYQFLFDFKPITRSFIRLNKKIIYKINKIISS